MEAPTSDLHQLVTTSRRITQRLLTIGENRLMLLTIEMQEERTRLLHVVLAALGMAVFALLGGMALSAAVAVLLWPYAPVAVLLGLACVYGLVAIAMWRWASGLLSGWRSFPDTLEQLRKDRLILDAIPS